MSNHQDCDLTKESRTGLTERLYAAADRARTHVSQCSPGERAELERAAMESRQPLHVLPPDSIAELEAENRSLHAKVKALEEQVRSLQEADSVIAYLEGMLAGSKWEDRLPSLRPRDCDGDPVVKYIGEDGIGIRKAVLYALLQNSRAAAEAKW